ncbi:hypothetical protein CTAYLR_010607 [Chrysophaeum taylorii]|uniref:2-dehydropantoate 2-reductase n=1 Tax=Chrysophaeum taylorii TaxID=2483200 RepID=A0AAD7UI01_9STRA|nr:hypothetical protein CTAYLR_010607 [Chrysophaeum taylorii]
MIEVVGGGALGSMIAARLRRAGAGVVLVVRSGNEEQRRRRVRVRSRDEEDFEVDLPVAARSGGTGRRAIVCTKAFDAAEAIAACVDKRPLVLSNGILALRDTTAPFMAAAATTTHGCYVEDGTIVHAGFGTLWLPRNTLAPELLAAGLRPVEIDHREMTERLWLKLAANATLNPLTALLGCRNGDVLPRAEAEVRMVCDELATLANTYGVSLSADTLFAAVEDCVRDNAANFSSMYQDVKHGRRTEIDALNGWVVDASRRRGLETPVACADLLQAIKNL